MSGPDEDYVAYVSGRLPVLRRTAAALVGDAHRGDDLVQHAITRLYLHWRRVSQLENLDAYVYKILMRAFLQERRLRWSAVRLRPAPVDDERGVDPTVGVTDRLLLHQALATLPPRQRAVLVLRFLHDRPVDEVARILDISAGTVKSQTHDGLGALRRYYEEDLPMSTVDVQGAVRDGRRRRRVGVGVTAGATALALIAITATVWFSLHRTPSPQPLGPTPGCADPSSPGHRFDPLLDEIDTTTVVGLLGLRPQNLITQTYYQMSNLGGSDRHVLIILYACEGEPTFPAADSQEPTPFDPAVAEPAQPVRGAAAYWVGSTLFWQWAPGAWAQVEAAGTALGQDEAGTALGQDELRATAITVAAQLVLGNHRPITAPIALPAPDGLIVGTTYTAGSADAAGPRFPTGFLVTFEPDGTAPGTNPYEGGEEPAGFITVSADLEPTDPVPPSPEWGTFPEDLGYPAYWEAVNYQGVIATNILRVTGFHNLQLEITVTGGTEAERATTAAEIFRSVAVYPDATADATTWGPPILS